MKLRRPTTAEQAAARAYGYGAVWASVDGRWFIGTWPVIYGVRAIAWRQDSTGRCVDYCAGSDTSVLLELLHLLRVIFEGHLEDGASERTVEQLLPGWERRPINTDPKCWDRLKQLAKETANGQEQTDT